MLPPQLKLYLQKKAAIDQDVKDKDSWIRELGFVDSFSPEQQDATAQALRMGLIGGASGALSGAIAHKNPWMTGAGAGLGAALGNYGMGHLGNPGTTSQAILQLLGTAGGGGLGYWLAQKQKKQQKVQLPGGLQIKTSAWTDQLPSFRWADRLLGGGVGALGGMVYDKYHQTPRDSEYLQKKQKVKRMLMGAGLGALTAGIVGDRGRRYISNTMVPEGYEPKTTDSGGLDKVYQAAILDQPVYPLESPKAQARYELNRRSLGVHSDNILKDIWKKQQDNTYSLNPQKPGIEKYVKEFFNPLNDSDPLDPVKMVGAVNSNLVGGGGVLAGNVVGGQRVPLYPYMNPKTDAVDSMLGKIRDRWDVSIDSHEVPDYKALAWNKLKGLVGMKPSPLPNESSAYTGKLSDDQRLKSYIQRSIMDKLIMKDPVWVSQNVNFNKANGNWTMTPSTSDAETYTKAHTLFQDTSNPQAPVFNWQEQAK